MADKESLSSANIEINWEKNKFSPNYFHFTAHFYAFPALQALIVVHFHYT